MVFNGAMVISLLGILILVGTGCGSQIPTNAILTASTIQQELTATAFIGIPEISKPPIQSNNESKAEFVVRIGATKIISEHSFLIALSQIGKENLWFGVSRDIKGE